MGIRPRDLLREKGTPYAELGLEGTHWTDDELIDQMLAHPILINRPIVITPWGVKLCRPSEAVFDILPLPQKGPFAKEDGEPVIDSEGRRVAPAPCLPNIDLKLFKRPGKADFGPVGASSHPPRILLLYGSLRERSFSKLLTLEAQRLLRGLRCASTTGCQPGNRKNC